MAYFILSFFSLVLSCQPDCGRVEINISSVIQFVLFNGVAGLQEFIQNKTSECMDVPFCGGELTVGEGEICLPTLPSCIPMFGISCKKCIDITSQQVCVANVLNCRWVDGGCTALAKEYYLQPDGSCLPTCPPFYSKSEAMTCSLIPCSARAPIEGNCSSIDDSDSQACQTGSDGCCSLQKVLGRKKVVIIVVAVVAGGLLVASAVIVVVLIVRHRKRKHSNYHVRMMEVTNTVNEPIRLEVSGEDAGGGDSSV